MIRLVKVFGLFFGCSTKAVDREVRYKIDRWKGVLLLVRKDFC